MTPPCPLSVHAFAFLNVCMHAASGCSGQVAQYLRTQLPVLAAALQVICSLHAAGLMSCMQLWGTGCWMAKRIACMQRGAAVGKQHSPCAQLSVLAAALQSICSLHAAGLTSYVQLWGPGCCMATRTAWTQRSQR